MKILVVIPCLYGPDHTREAIESLINKPDVDVLLIDNGAEDSVKSSLNYYYLAHKSCCELIQNKNNIYVNPAWQQGINYFLKHPEYSHIIIMNSDLIMQNDWANIVKNIWSNDPDAIIIPQNTQDKNFRFDVPKETTELLQVHEGTPGVFITMNRKQAEIINPIPSELKIWFGDNWIFEILRGCGYKTLIPNNLWSYHYWSQNVQKVAGISEMIEEDKRQWEIVKHRKEAVIQKYKL